MKYDMRSSLAFRTSGIRKCLLEIGQTLIASCKLPIALAAMTLLFTGCHPLRDKSAAEAAVTEFHTRLDAGSFDSIYSDADDSFKSAGSYKDFSALLAAVHKKLGNVQS